jgi:hypothetical protein
MIGKYLEGRREADGYGRDGNTQGKMKIYRER